MQVIDNFHISGNVEIFENNWRFFVADYYLLALAPNSTTNRIFLLIFINTKILPILWFLIYFKFTNSPKWKELKSSQLPHYSSWKNKEKKNIKERKTHFHSIKQNDDNLKKSEKLLNNKIIEGMEFVNPTSSKQPIKLK